MKETILAFLKDKISDHQEAWDLFLKILWWVFFVVVGGYALIGLGLASSWTLFVLVAVVYASVIITGLARADIDW